MPVRADRVEAAADTFGAALTHTARRLRPGSYYALFAMGTGRHCRWIGHRTGPSRNYSAMFVVTAPLDRDQPASGTVENCPEIVFSLHNVTGPLMEAARVATDLHVDATASSVRRTYLDDRRRNRLLNNRARWLLAYSSTGVLTNVKAARAA